MSKPPKETTTVIGLDDEPVETPAADVAAVIDEDPEAAAAAVVDEDDDQGVALPKRARKNPDRTITLRLREPREVQIRSSSGGVRTETYAELVFHPMNGGDLNALLAASKETAHIVLLARVTRIREAIMKVLFTRLDAADIADAYKVADAFFPSGRTTGR